MMSKGMAYPEDDAFEIFTAYQEAITGFKPSDDGTRATGQCPFHEDKHASFSVDLRRGFWKCHAGCGQGNLPTFRKRAGMDTGGTGIVATYDYHDETGKLLYQVVRLQPKTFRARRKNDKGEWTWTMGSTRRVLYKLPNVLVEADPVVIVEGEQDANNLRKAGANATTCPFGAGKWDKTYAQLVAGRNVVVIADNDEPGRLHMLQVARSCFDAGCKVKVIAKIEGVADKGDVSDWLASHQGMPATDLIGAAVVFDPVMILQAVKPAVIVERTVKSIEELAVEYSEYIDNLSKRKVMFGLIEIDNASRGLVPGEVAFLVARSKSGKSLYAQNLIRWLALKHQPTLFLSMEQPGIQVLERHAQMEIEKSGDTIEEMWHDLAERTKIIARLGHLSPYCWTVDKGSVALREIPGMVDEATTRAGQAMSLVLVDYLGYMNMDEVGTREYDQLSNTSRAFKAMAKEIAMPILVVSQSHRGMEGDDGSRPITLSSARGSGAIEESADVILGMYRPKLHEEDGLPTMTVAIQVVACRKGRPGEAWYQVDRRSLRIDPVGVPMEKEEAITAKAKAVKPTHNKRKKRADTEDLDPPDIPVQRIPTEDEQTELKGILG